VIFDTPGGGGMGRPGERNPAQLRADLESGLVTPAGAARDYGNKTVGVKSGG
jgi:N-methylhydantoinase B